MKKPLRRQDLPTGNSFTSGFFDKPLSAFWTGDLQLALFARHAQGVLTARAFEVLMRLQIFQSLFLRRPKTEESVIFRPAPRNIAREHPEKREKKHEIREIEQIWKDDTGDQTDHKGHNNKRNIELVRAVPPNHKVSEKIHRFYSS